MSKKGKLLLTLATFTLVIAVAAKYLIQASDVIAPTFNVVVAKTEIKVGDVINESSIELMIVPSSLVKSNAFYWSSDAPTEAEKTQINSEQIHKIVGKTATKLINRGEQITVLVVK